MIKLATAEDIDHLQRQIDQLKAGRPFRIVTTAKATVYHKKPSRGSLAAKVAKRYAGKAVTQAAIRNYYKKPDPSIVYAMNRLVRLGYAEKTGVGVWRVK